MTKPVDGTGAGLVAALVVTSMTSMASMACDGTAPSNAVPVPEPAPSPTASSDKTGSPDPTDTARTFGRPMKDGIAEVSLATLLARPEAYADRSVRTRGVVSRVCQSMGCWLELRDPDAGARLRAPMAGHAFFVPQSLVGKSALLEGTVRVQALTDAQKAHYRAEGMQAVEAAVSLDADSVAIVDE